MPPEPQERKDNIHNKPAAPWTSRKFVTENTAFDLGPFVLEWFARNRPANQLPISAVCNCHCLFCSNHLNPFPVVGGVFRDLEDIRLQLCSMASNDDPIRAGLSALEKWPDDDLFLVPSNPFDALLRDLVGTPAYRISERLGRPVWLVQSDGIIDSLLSMRLPKRRKPLDPGLKKAVALTPLP